MINNRSPPFLNVFLILLYNATFSILITTLLKKLRSRRSALIILIKKTTPAIKATKATKATKVIKATTIKATITTTRAMNLN